MRRGCVFYSSSAASKNGGFLATLRRLVEWNRTNAAHTHDAAPHVDQSNFTRDSMVSAAVRRDSPLLKKAGFISSTAASSSSSSLGRLSGMHSSSSSASSSSSSSSGGPRPYEIDKLFEDHVVPAEEGVAAALPHATSALDVVEAAVRARWSCRQFDPERPIDTALMQRILEATTRAPTGYNLQGWHAIVVREDAKKAELFAAGLGQRQILHAPMTIIFAADTTPEANAPQALEIGLDSGAYGPTYGPPYLRNIYYYLHGGPLQTMAATKSMVSSWYSSMTHTSLISVPVSRAGYAWKQAIFPATTFLNLCAAAGIDSCIMEGIDEDAVRRVVGLPERFTIPIIVSVGYADRKALEATARAPYTPRFSVSHLVRWDKF